MKTFTIIGFSIALLTIGTLLFWHHTKRPIDAATRRETAIHREMLGFPQPPPGWSNANPSDEAIRRELPGTWVILDSRSTSSLDLNGHCVTQLTGKHIGRLEGTWQVQDGFYIYTVTNSSFTKHLPYTIVERVLHMEGHELTMQADAKTVYVMRKVEP